MADLVTRMQQQLRIRGEGRGRMTRKERAQDELGRRVLAVLRQSAPKIARMDPDAPWDAQTQESIKAALGTEFGSDALVDHASDLVARVIQLGKDAGVWPHTPWPRRRRVMPQRGLLSRKDLKLLGQSRLRKLELIQQLPGVLASLDAHVVAGALLVSAADISCILLGALHPQIVDPRTPTARHGNNVWMDFKLGVSSPVKGSRARRVQRAWRNPRRWIMDDVSVLLHARFVELAQRPLDAERCLQACVRFIRIAPTTLETLARSARVDWSRQVPSLLITYATTPTIAPSLPLHAFYRLLVGRPLPPGVAPLAPRRLAALDAAKAARALRHAQPTTTAQTNNPGKQGVEAQTASVEKLARILRRLPKSDAAADALATGLAQWDAAHASADDWPTLIRYWISDTLLAQKKNPYARNDGWVRVPGMLRYVDGFAKRWVAHFHDLAPSTILADPGMLAERVRSLIVDIAGIQSADVSHTALRQFLEFVEETGGPKIVIKRDGDVVISPRDADANLLTPPEYVALLVETRKIENAYERNRAQTLSTLAYRTALRWSELQALRLRDAMVERATDGRVEILFKVREDDDNTLKSMSSRRSLTLSRFLSREELDFVSCFIEFAREAGGAKRPGSHYLFADLDALHLPPDETRTRDLIQQIMRQVSGDPTVVFHSLRHSSANAMFWRLFLEDPHDPESLAWSPGTEHVSATGLGYEGFWMTAITGRPADHPSRLHVISQALGQLGPGTALTYYLHTLEFLMHREVRKHLEIPDDVAAALEATAVDSIRRRRARGKNPLDKSLRAAREAITDIAALWGSPKK